MSSKHKRAYQKISEILSEYGCTILTPLSDFTGASSIVEYLCHTGHKTSGSCFTLRKHYFCKACKQEKSKTQKTKQLKAYAKKKNGKVIEVTGQGNNTRVKMQCRYGHTWETRAWSLLNGKSWCPTCSKVKKGKMK